MYCTKCRKKVEKDHKFCSFCGSLVMETTEEVNEQKSNTNNSGISKSSSEFKEINKKQKSIAFGILGGIAVITAIVIFIIGNPFGNNKPNPESMIGTWEFLDAPYYITIKDDSSFEIKYFEDELGNDSDTKVEAVFMGKAQIYKDGDIYLICTDERTNPRDTWTSTSKIPSLRYFETSDDNIYSFEGDPICSYLDSVRLKKMVMPEDYSKAADEKTTQILNDIYSSEGNYKVSLISSEWNTDHENCFIEGKCNFFLQGENTILAPMVEVNVEYNLSRKSSPFAPTYLRIMDSETSRSSVIYNYDSVKGTFTHTNEKPVIPNDI